MRHLISRLIVTAGVMAFLWVPSGRADAQTPAGVFVSPVVFSASGQASVVFGGGTVDQLEDAARKAAGTGVWAQDVSGSFQLLVVDGPAFLKEGFKAKFPVGFAAATAVTVVLPTAAPAGQRPLFAIAGKITSPESPQGFPSLNTVTIRAIVPGTVETLTPFSANVVGTNFKIEVPAGTYWLDLVVPFDPGGGGGLCDFYYNGPTSPLSLAGFRGFSRVAIEVTSDMTGFDLTLPAGRTRVLNGRGYCAS